ncbi:MAG TPA: cytochrome c-type biogenesis protein CcmH, partial [Burkholderiales bacterium]|nr:cytochrome c-type biogenesis protein CcmH [Burkholderiales bacterium]
MRRIVVALAMLFGACGALAREAAPLADDPQVEARLSAIAEELRCLVCQNESLIASRADLAMDL